MYLNCDQAVDSGIEARMSVSGIHAGYPGWWWDPRQFHHGRQSAGYDSCKESNARSSQTGGKPVTYFIPLLTSTGWMRD